MANLRRYGLLGPLDLVTDNGDHPPLAARLRTVLALLLVRANTPVSATELCEELWGEHPPATARNSLQVFIKGLRAVLCPDVKPRDPDQLLRTSTAGYTLRVEQGELDSWLFEQLTDRGRAASPTNPKLAGELFREALGLWRGVALADIPTGSRLQLRARALEESRMVVLEQRIDVDLRLEQHRELITELRTLTATNPLREEFWRQLMIALHRSQRRADALETFRQLRDTMVGELGVEPGPAISRLHDKILNSESTQDQGGGHSSTAVTARPRANYLPPDIADFVGREAQVSALESVLGHRTDASSSTAAPTVTISGKPGSGKTTLSVHVAHKLRHRYPDGQLYVNLRGSSDSPVSSTEVLARFLRALGVHGAALPESMDEREDMFRDHVSDRKILLLLDDAEHESQVRPLLPSGSGCGMIITSRRRLSGLSGSIAMDLQNFNPDEARTLLKHLAGPARIDEESAATAQVTRLCGLLPLAIRVAGGKLARKPHWSMGDLAERLADERGRLSELSVGDLDVRTSIESSYRACSPDQRRVFRMLGLLSTDEVPSWMAAALTGIGQNDAEIVLEQLVDWQLLHVGDRDAAGQLRYQLHDLLRVFAAEQASTETTAVERESALRRVLNTYRELARLADIALQPGRRQPSLPDSVHVNIDTKTRNLVAANPLSWFSAERLSLLDAISQAHATMHWQHVWTLVDAVQGFFDIRFYCEDRAQTVELGLDAAERDGDAYGLALMRHATGELRFDQGRLPEAVDCYERSIAVLRELGCHREADRVYLDLAAALASQGRIDEAFTHLIGYPERLAQAGDVRAAAFAHTQLGTVCRYQGRLTDARVHTYEALRLYRELGDRRWEAEVLRRVGNMYSLTNRLSDAAESLLQCLAIQRELNDSRGQSMALRALGVIRVLQDRPAEAEPCFQDARQIMIELRDRRNEAYMAQALGDLYRKTSRSAESRELLEHSLSIFTAVGDERGRTLTYLSLGKLERSESRFTEAIELTAAGLTLARKLPVPLWEAAALRDQGLTFAESGDTNTALEHWRAALVLYRSFDSGEADKVQTLLESHQSGSA